MFQLLNRLAWVMSFCVGLLSAFFIGGRENILWGLIIAIIIKYVVFSPKYITSRLQFFKKQILKNAKFKDSSQLNDIEQESFKVNETEKTDTISIAESKLEEDTEEIKYRAQEEKRDVISKVSKPGIISKFFSENILAKLGGILVFLGVLFLLSLVYSVIGPIAKMIIGFAIGFGAFAIGVWLDKKGFINESRIVMGLAILINYLVILSGRYLLGSDASSDATLLSVTTTFIFLIMNTIFAVVTALVYNSRTLLIFSFAFAYINPLLLGESGSEPYTLLGYTMIVTLGALYMSYRKKDEILFPLAFVLASIMFLIAPWSDGAGWITKLLCINTLGALSLYVSTIFKKSGQFLSEILIGGTFFLIGIMGFLGIENLSQAQMLIMGASSLGLMAFCYFYSNKSVYLYSIGTLGTVLTLSPALYTNGLHEGIISISIAIIIVFGLMNIGLILMKTKELLANNIGNIIFGLLSGAMFLTYMIYFFGNEFFPGILQGFAFFGLAIIYCSLAFLIINKIGIETIKTDEKYENIFYSISAIGISLFSLAIAFVFSENKEIVSIVWLLEANILFFLAGRIKSIKVSLAGLILFIIGIIKFADFVDFRVIGGTSFAGDYGILIALLVVLLSLAYNLIVLSPKRAPFLKTEFYVIHHFFHLIGIGLIIITGHEVLDISKEWFSLLYFSSFIGILTIFYRYICNSALTIVSNIGTLGIYCIHIMAGLFALGGGFFGSFEMNLLVSILITVSSFGMFFYEYFTKNTIISKKMLGFSGIYLLIITSIYVLYISDITFAVTLYWGILAFAFLSHGISRNLLYMRTIGLYLISLTAGKIFFYDIWVSVDNIISRVVALIVVGILMIVLSTMYTRKYGNTLNNEFNISNLFSNKKTKKSK